MLNAFEIALEAAALGVVFTWGTIFVCQLRLRSLSKRGVVPPSSFQMPGHPYTSIIGLVFLASISVGLAITGWQASPRFWHKTTVLVVAGSYEQAPAPAFHDAARRRRERYKMAAAIRRSRCRVELAAAIGGSMV